MTEVRRIVPFEQLPNPAEKRKMPLSLPTRSSVPIHSPFSPLRAGGRREDDRDRETWGLHHQSQERQPGRCRGTPPSRCESVEHIVSMQEPL